MRDYSATDLMDLAGSEPPDLVTLGAADTITGVVVLKDFAAGQIVNPTAARRFAAQLLRMADLHDAIYENGHEQGFRRGQDNMRGAG